jgi:hypothetical protein
MNALPSSVCSLVGALNIGPARGTPRPCMICSVNQFGNNNHTVTNGFQMCMADWTPWVKLKEESFGVLMLSVLFVLFVLCVLLRVPCCVVHAVVLFLLVVYRRSTLKPYFGPWWSQPGLGELLSLRCVCMGVWVYVCIFMCM